jgi:predicted amidohydrolase
LAEVIAAYPDADVAVFPELYLSGYDATHAVRLACAATGCELASVRQAAARNATAVIVGFPERLESGAIADSVACIDQSGALVGVYRKTHLFGDELSTFEAGGVLLVVELFGKRVAPLICFDVEFPEPARSCALAGAEVLVTASANMEPFFAEQRIAAQARALENRLPHLYVNRCGTERNLRFVGGTCAIGADGAVLAETAPGDEEILYLEVPFEHVRDSRIDYLRLRRGDLMVASPSTSDA